MKMTKTTARNLNKGYKQTVNRTADKLMTHMRFLKLLRNNPDLFYPDYWLKYTNDLETELIELLRLMKHNMNTCDIGKLLHSLNTHKAFLRPRTFTAIKESIESRELTSYVITTKKFERVKMLLGENGEYYAQGARSLFGFSVTHEHVHSVPQLTPIVETLDSLLTPHSAYMGKFLRQATICFVGLVNSENYITRTTSVLAFLNAFDCVGSWVERYAQEVAQVFKPPSTEFVAQSFTANGEYLITGTIKLLLNMFQRSSSELVAIDEKRSRRIQTLARTCTSISALIKFTSTLINESLKYVKAMILGVDVNLIDLMEYEIDIRKWHTRVHQIVVNDGMLLAARDSELASEIKRLYDQGAQFQDMILKCRVPRNIAEVFYKTFQTLSTLHKETIAFCGYDRIRPSPFVLHIFGASGVGKSTMMHFLLNDVYNKREMPFNRQHDIYVRNSVQSFWDGYKNQKIVLFDDFMQSQVETDLSQILVELVRCKNTMAFPLQMASLEHKGNTRFTSEFIYISSNKDIPQNISCVLDSNAIRRRRDIVVKAVVKQNFRSHNGGIDSAKVAEYMETQPYIDTGDGPHARVFCRDIYEFQVYTKGCENNAGAYDNKTWEWDDLVTNITESWNKLSLSEQAIEKEVAHDNFVSVLKESVSAPEEVAKELKWAYHYNFAKITNLSHPLIDRWNNLKTPEFTPLNTLYDFFSGHTEKIKAFTALTTFAAATSLVWSLLANYTNPKAEFVSGDEKTKRLVRKVVSAENAPERLKYTPMDRNTLTPDSHLFKAESSCDPNGYDILCGKVASNHIMLDFWHADGNTRNIGLGICGRAVICPTHAFQLATGETQVDVRKAGNIELGSFLVREVERYDLPEQDLTIFILPKTFQLFPDLRPHIATSDISRIPLTSTLLFTMVRTKETIMHHSFMIPYLQYGGRMRYMSEGEPIHIAKHFRYHIPTASGDCGSIVYALGKNCTRKIVGMHVAGSSEFGVSSILNVDTINAALEQMNPGPNLVGAEFTRESYHNSGLIAHSKYLDHCGEINKRYQQRQPSKTDICPSLLHGKVFPVVTAPSALAPTRDHNPLLKGILKSDVGPILFPPPDVHRALCDMTASLLSLKNEPPDRKILTIQQAINGDPNDRCLTSMNLKSSPGFPFVHLKHTQLPGKYEFFKEVADHNYEPTEELLKRIDLRLEAAKRGQIVPVIFYDILKDERRSLAKVESGDTRVFSVGPLDLNVLIRMYFGRAISYLQYNCVLGECSVGINPHGVDWKLMYKELTSFYDNFIQGDYGSFDKVLPYQLIESVYGFFRDFYNDGHDVERYTLYLSLFSCYRLAGKQVYKPLGGNPSGNPLTVIINSLCNMMLVRLAYFNMYPTRTLPLSSSLMIKVYGYDLLMGVSSDSPEFTFRSFKQFLNHAGLDFKEPKKTAKIYDYVPIQQVEYLKRMFAVSSYGILAPLDMKSITEMVNWVRISPDPREAIIQNLDVVRRELIYHGEETYNNYFTRIVDAATTLKLGVVFVPYLVSIREWIESNQ